MCTAEMCAFSEEFDQFASRDGTLLEEKFFSGRAYFLVDKQGIIRWSSVEDTSGHRRENAEILAEIAKLP